MIRVTWDCCWMGISVVGVDPLGPQALAVILVTVVRPHFGPVAYSVSGSRRSFTVGGQEWRFGAVPPVGSRSKAPGGDLGGFAPTSWQHFVKVCYFVMVLIMTAIFEYAAYKCSIWNGRKICLGVEKWYGKQQWLPIAHKRWADDCPLHPVGSAANAWLSSCFGSKYWSCSMPLPLFILRKMLVGCILCSVSNVVVLDQVNILHYQYSKWKSGSCYMWNVR